MEKKTKHILIAGGVVVAGIVTYVLVKKKTNIKAVADAAKVKIDSANAIVTSGNAADVSTLLTFDDNYIQAWYNAVKTGKPNFSLGGKTYKTSGGEVLTPADVAVINPNDVYAYTPVGLAYGAPFWNWVKNLF